MKRPAGFWLPCGEGARELRRLNDEGVGMIAMAAHFGVSAALICKVMARLGIEYRGDGRRGSRNPDYDRRVAEMRLAGMSGAEIARKLGISPAAVSKRVKRLRIVEDPDSDEGLGHKPVVKPWRIENGVMTREIA